MLLRSFASPWNGHFDRWQSGELEVEGGEHLLGDWDRDVEVARQDDEGAQLVHGGLDEAVVDDVHQELDVLALDLGQLDGLDVLRGVIAGGVHQELKRNVITQQD